MKRLQKTSLLTLIIMLLLSNITLASSQQSPSSSPRPINKDEFLDLAKENQFYKDFEEEFISSDYMLLNPLLDENEKQYGWIVQYEISPKENTKEGVNVEFSSILSLSYDYTIGKIQSILIDYDEIISDEAIYIRDLSGSNKDVKVDVSDDELFNDFTEEVKEEKKERILYKHQ